MIVSCEVLQASPPGVTVGGGAAIGDYSAICLGASIVNGVRIGSHFVVAAGAIVVRDIPDRVVVYGDQR
jgi:acetyltransferase-like isoleucine patch superfamily enzyme